MLRLDVLRTHCPLIFEQWKWVILYGSTIVSLTWSLDCPIFKYVQGQGFIQCQKPLANIMFGVVQHTTDFRYDFLGLLAGEILFWANFIISFALSQYRQEQIRIRITVRHQYACSITCWILYSSDNDNNKAYVMIIGKFYVIVHSRRRWDGT